MKKITSKLGILALVVMLFTSTAFAAYGTVGASGTASLTSSRTVKVTGKASEVGGAAASKITNIYVRLMVYAGGVNVGDVNKTEHQVKSTSVSDSYTVPSSSSQYVGVYGSVLARTRYSDDSTSEAIKQTTTITVGPDIARINPNVDVPDTKDEVAIANDKNVAVSDFRFIPFNDLCNIATTDENPYAKYVSVLFNYLEFHISEGDKEPSGVYVDTDTQNVYIIKTGPDLVYKYVFDSSENRYLLDVIM